MVGRGWSTGERTLWDWAYGGRAVGSAATMHIARDKDQMDAAPVDRHGVLHGGTAESRYSFR
jgi:hypothetical protein